MLREITEKNLQEIKEKGQAHRRRVWIESMSTPRLLLSFIWSLFNLAFFIGFSILIFYICFFILN